MEASIKRRFCFNCGTKLVEEANFCYHCGLNVNNPQIQDFISSKSVAEAEFIIQEKFLNDDGEIVVRGIVPDKMEIRRNDIMALRKCDKAKIYVNIVRIESQGKEYAQAKIGQYVDIVLELNERTGRYICSKLTIDCIDYEDALIHDLVQISEIDKENICIKTILPGCDMYIFEENDYICVMKDRGRIDDGVYRITGVSEKESVSNIYNNCWGTIIELELDDEVEGLQVGDWLCLVSEYYTLN